MVHAATFPYSRQDDAPSNLVPFPGSNQAINDETKSVYDDGYRADPEPVDMSAPVDPTGDILSAHGPSVLACYHLIRYETEQNGGCRLGYEGIGARMRCTERTAMRHVKTLIDGGFVESRKRTREDGSTLANELVPSCTYGVTCKTLRGDIGGDMHVGGGVTSGVTFSPTPPIERVNVNSPLNPPKPPKTKAGPYTEGFETFWRSYPRKDNRKDALKIWDRIKPDAALLATMLAAIERQGLAKKEPRFRPMPTTWLNGERWNNQGDAGPDINDPDFDPLTLPYNSPLRAKLTGKPVLA